MPTPYIKSVSDKTGKSVKELEKLWDKAKEIALKDRKESDKDFYAYVTGIFKKMAGITQEEGESSTQSADIAQPDRHLLGRPLFRVKHDDFFKIGFNKRERGWWKKFYGSTMGEWCKANKGKKFTIQHEDNDWLMDLEAN